MAITQRETVLRQALATSGVIVPPPVEESGDLYAQVAKQSYDYNYDIELARFPWGFAVERAKLMPFRDLGNESPGFRYRYEIPDKVLFLWDVYIDTPSFSTSSLDTYNYPQITFPFVSAPKHLRGLAEAVNGGLESNAKQFNIFYTHKNKIPEGKLSVPFISLLTEAVRLDVKMAKSADASVLSFHNKRKEDGRKMSHNLASVENQRAKKVDLTPLVKEIRGLPR